MLKSKRLLVLTLVIAMLVSLIPCMNVSAAYNLVWQDEFDTGSLNTSNWTCEIGTGSGGWGNNELEYYTDRSQNVRIENGNLVIQALKESYGGMSYTSARLKTQGKRSWTYGKVEARIKIPTGQGVWPAFWMLGNNISTVSWPACGEIDIMEHVNNEATAHGTIHWDYNGYQYYGGPSPNLDFSQYHVYAIEWNSSSIKWFIDGVQYREANIANNINGTDEFHRPFFILLNLAIGGNWPGSPNSSTPFPATMYVDYVRVYQDGGTSTQVATPTFSPGGGTYSSAQTVTMSCATAGATIRYTTNGTEPTASSTQYTAPITVSSTTTVKAKAFKSGMTDSATASAAYTISTGGGGSTTWYLYNTAVSGVTPAGENMQTANSGVTGWQPLRTVNTTTSYWYTPALTQNIAAGNYTFTLWTNNPGGTTNVKVELYKVSSSGGSAVLLGSQTQNVLAATGNHATTFTFSNVAAQALSNQRLQIRITKTSGSDVTMCYNTNDFPTRLVTP